MCFVGHGLLINKELMQLLELFSSDTSEQSSGFRTHLASSIDF